jgi:hypothetical protein
MEGNHQPGATWRRVQLLSQGFQSVLPIYIKLNGIKLGIGSSIMERVFSVVAGITEALVFAAIAVAMITVVWVAL